MFEQDLSALIKEHYGQKDANVLLLSDVGKLVTDKGLQQDAGERRSLREIVEQIEDLTVIRDSEASAFIAVVLKGDEKRAEERIVERNRRQFLRDLARPILLAFTLEIANGQTMSVQLDPKIAYQGGPSVEQGWIEVDSDLRLPGLDVENVDALDPSSASELETRIRAWCDRKGVDPSKLRRPRRKPLGKGSETSPHARNLSQAPASVSALERLLAAQEPDVARRLNVPIDIALALSRMP